MIQVRNGIFETNSSSVHAISVYTVPPKDIPKEIHLTLGEYGWGHGLYSLPNYIFTACAEMKRIDDLIGMLDAIGVECTMDPTPDVIAARIKERGYLPTILATSIIADVSAISSMQSCVMNICSNAPCSIRSHRLNLVMITCTNMKKKYRAQLKANTGIPSESGIDMIQIRNSIFETNSSSVHSLCVMTRSDYQMWTSGEMFYNDCTGDLPDICTRQQALEWLQKNFPEDFDPESSSYWKNNYDSENMMLREEGFYEYDFFVDFNDIRTADFTTPGGEEIVAICGERYC